MTSIRHLEITVVPKLGPAFTINSYATAILQPQVFIKFQVEKQVSNEPNKASLEIYNLSEEHSSAIDFKFDLYDTFFGAQIFISGGFLSDGPPKQMYAGIIINALTTFEAPNFITRIECSNRVRELESRPVSYTVVGGSTKKVDVILSVIKQANGFIEPSEESYLRKTLGTATYDEDEIIYGTLKTITTIIENGLPRRIIIYWDDAGVIFTPVGKISAGRKVKIVSQETGMIGVPRATTGGLEFETRLDPTYRINDPVIVKADNIARLSLTASRTTIATNIPGLGSVLTVAPGVVFSDTTVTSKVIHSGDNREGDFKTSITTKFTNLIQQATA